MARGRWQQSMFTPKHPEKYVGHVDRIFARSSWERQMFIAMDNNPAITKWSSEEVHIPYRCPVSGTRKNYYPDVLARTTQKDGSEKVFLIEIKPEHETKPPKNKKNTYAVATYMRNKAKWDAAEKYAAARGWEFKIISEAQIKFFK